MEDLVEKLLEFADYLESQSAFSGNRDFDNGFSTACVGTAEEIRLLVAEDEEDA